MIPILSGTRLSGSAGSTRPLLVLGPSLGTSAATLWAEAARHLTDFDVIGWDLPGHGMSPPAKESFSIPELATAVGTFAAKILEERGTPAERYYYAGDSVGGAVGLQLLLDHSADVIAAVLLCTGARIGTPDGWRDRAVTVRAGGTPVMVAPSAQRWFGPGFLDRSPDVGSALLDVLHNADTASYAWVCEALAGFDVRDRLPEIQAPILAVAGAADQATPVSDLRYIADGVQHGSLQVLDAVAHQAPAEAPGEVAELINQHLRAVPGRGDRTLRQVRDAGMAVRREVLGDAHVDRATAAATDLTREFQEFITQYAWGTIWTRPGLDRRSRSLITLTALIARGHHDELEMHLHAARTNGLSTDEIKELILQTAIYCGVPDANTAFRIAQQVLSDPETATGSTPPSGSGTTTHTDPKERPK